MGWGLRFPRLAHGAVRLPVGSGSPDDVASIGLLNPATARSRHGDGGGPQGYPLKTPQQVVIPGIGGLRLSEVTPSRMDGFIQERRRVAGYSVAKLCRSVASGVCGYAVRRDAMRFNPVRDIESLESPDTREARALTDEGCARWLAVVDASKVARDADLPDLARVPPRHGMPHR